MTHVFYTFAPVREIGETDVRALCSCAKWCDTEPEADNPGSDIKGFTWAGEQVRNKLYARYQKHLKDSK